MKSTKKTASPAPAPATTTPGLAPESKITRIPRAKKDSAATPPAPAPVTVITAKIDVGFGNTLYLRGDGPGLSWNKGLPLTCTADTVWTLAVAGATRPIVCKFLLNDATWSRGEDYTVPPGSATELAPSF
jgi:hypothetical protein